MELGLTGKIVFITGSTRGIGLATAKGFLSEGATVILNGRNRVELDGIVESLNAVYCNRIFGLAGDITNQVESEEVVRMINDQFQHLDVLVANLGSGKPECDNPLCVSEWKRFYEVNVLGNLGTVDKLHPLLQRSASPSVIFLSSIVARQRVSAPVGYAAAKSGVLSLAKYLSKNWADDNIRVNCILPGNIYFKGGRWEELDNTDHDGVSNYINTEVPMKRFGKPEEIADAILFLSSSRASYITGASIVVDGGQLSTI